jgi:hypothetical protein
MGINNNPYMPTIKYDAIPTSTATANATPYNNNPRSKTPTDSFVRDPESISGILREKTNTKKTLKTLSRVYHMSIAEFDIAELMAKARATIKEKDTAAAAVATRAKPKLTIATATASSRRVGAPAAAAAPSFLETAASAVGAAATYSLRGITGINPVGKVPTDEELKDFYKRRKKHPERYTIDPKGNLVVRSKTGAVEKIYTIPPYRSPTTDELKELEDTRRTAVKEVEERYEDAIGELSARMDEYRRGEASAGDVVAANTRLAAIDAERHTVMFPLREVRAIDGVEVRKVLFDQRDNPNTMTIYMPARRTLTLQEQYVREGDEVMPEAPVAAEGGQ